MLNQMLQQHLSYNDICLDDRLHKLLLQLYMMQKLHHQVHSMFDLIQLCYYLDLYGNDTNTKVLHSVH